MALPGVLPAGGGTRGMAGHGPVLAGGGTRGMGTGFPLGELGQALATGPGTGGGALVGILDGPLYPHPDLVGHVPAELLLHALLAAQLHGGDRRQWEGHATFVASVIARQAPLAALDPRAVLGGETGTASLWDTATALVGFAGSGAAVLNLSFGCRTLDGRPPLLVARAVERLGPDVLCVAAAGNHGDLPDIRQDPVWPAALPGVVAVGATDEPGARFSPALPWVRCTAPGVGVSGAYLAGTVLNPADPEHAEPWSQEYHGYARWSGTSFAAAAVTGAVAAAIRPGMTAREALEELLATPDGLVRPYQQVDAVLA
jgi:subtilisin family serine protease